MRGIGALSPPETTDRTEDRLEIGPVRKAPPSSGEWRAWNDIASELADHHAPNEEAAEEARQQAMVRLFRLWAGVRRIRSWLAIVQLNLLKKAARKESQRVHVPLPSALPDRLPTIETHILVKETLAALPEWHRAVLELRAEELSHAEIAERLGCSVNQVGPRVQRAQEAARQVRDGMEARTPSADPR